MNGAKVIVERRSAPHHRVAKTHLRIVDHFYSYEIYEKDSNDGVFDLNIEADAGSVRLLAFEDRHKNFSCGAARGRSLV